MAGLLLGGWGQGLGVPLLAAFPLSEEPVLSQTWGLLGVIRCLSLVSRAGCLCLCILWLRCSRFAGHGQTGVPLLQGVPQAPANKCRRRVTVQDRCGRHSTPSVVKEPAGHHPWQEGMPLLQGNPEAPEGQCKQSVTWQQESSGIVAHTDQCNAACCQPDRAIPFGRHLLTASYRFAALVVQELGCQSWGLLTDFEK